MASKASVGDMQYYRCKMKQDSVVHKILNRVDCFLVVEDQVGMDQYDVSKPGRTANQNVSLVLHFLNLRRMMIEYHRPIETRDQISARFLGLFQDLRQSFRCL